MTRSSTAQKEDFHGSAPVAQEDCLGDAATSGSPGLVGQKLHIDLVGAKALESANSAELALEQALEFARFDVRLVDVRRSRVNGSLSGRAIFAGGGATIEAWPATGYVAVDVTTTRALRPELLLTALMDAFTAREAMIKRQRLANDGARYKKGLTVGGASAASVPAAKRLDRSVMKPVRARRAA
ncbi:MAG: S-adenosylmethionine decarboxylase [Hyphomicrobium sp.]